MSNLPLDTLIEMAEDEAEIAVMHFTVTQETCAAAHRQLADLQAYRRTYGERMHRELTSGTTAATLANTNSFLTMLDSSIAQQQRACQLADQRLSLARTQWQDSQRKLVGYRTLSERTARELRLVQDRRDQRSTDEQAARMFREGRQSNRAANA